jgi:DNA-directed RNA polymerase subunit RPC12/RpoP
MALFRNHYVCAACDGHWIAESVEVLEVDCPHCRVYDVVPYRSDDLTVVMAAETSTEKDLVAALKATAAKMRGKVSNKLRPIRAKGRGAARVAVH